MLYREIKKGSRFLESPVLASSGNWTRTSDLRVMSPTSYLLLYPAMWTTNIQPFLCVDQKIKSFYFEVV